MNTFLKTAILGLAAAAAVAAPISTASADSWRGNGGWHGGRHDGWNGGRGNWRGDRNDWNRHRPNYDRPRKRDRSDAIAAGVIGLAAGAIIAGALSQPSAPNYAPPPPQPRVYYPPQQTYNAYPSAPAPVQYRGGAQPWSQAWYNYCSQKFRSFNPKTGTYRGYDGANHFCVAN
ncbi:BA14K family protein [Brucellaceae bacterium C25G]